MSRSRYACAAPRQAGRAAAASSCAPWVSPTLPAVPPTTCPAGRRRVCHRPRACVPPDDAVLDEPTAASTSSHRPDSAVTQAPYGRGHPRPCWHDIEVLAPSHMIVMGEGNIVGGGLPTRLAPTSVAARLASSIVTGPAVARPASSACASAGTLGGADGATSEEESARIASPSARRPLPRRIPLAAKRHPASSRASSSGSLVAMRVALAGHR